MDNTFNFQRLIDKNEKKLIKLKNEKKVIKNNYIYKKNINEFKSKEFKSNLSFYYKRHFQKLLTFLDILFIMAILMNFGAVFLTNALVVKNTGSEIIFKEANPMQSEIYEKEENVDYFKFFIIHSLKISLLIMFYIKSRINIYNIRSIYYLIFLVITTFTILGLDFFNNAGYYYGLRFLL
jgi:hypothetical protein